MEVSHDSDEGHDSDGGAGKDGKTMAGAGVRAGRPPLKGWFPMVGGCGGGPDPSTQRALASPVACCPTGLLAVSVAGSRPLQRHPLPPGITKRMDVRLGIRLGSLGVRLARRIARGHTESARSVDRKGGRLSPANVGRGCDRRNREGTSSPQGRSKSAVPTPLPGQAPGGEEGPAELSLWDLSPSGRAPRRELVTRAPTLREAGDLAAAAPVAIRRQSGESRPNKTPQRLRVENFGVWGPPMVGYRRYTRQESRPGGVHLVFGVCILLILGVPRLVDAWRAEVLREGGRWPGRFATRASHRSADSPMEFGRSLRALWHRRTLLLVGVVLAGLAALFSVYQVGLFPRR